MQTVEDEWQCFLQSGSMMVLKPLVTIPVVPTLVPKPSQLYISTKTRMAHLSTEVDIHTIFWKLPIVSYSIPMNGCVQKQIKINSHSQEEVTLMQDKLKLEPVYYEHIISKITTSKRIKFKDVRKISIGISQRDVLVQTHKNKPKSAFYNCMVLLTRLQIEDNFHEFHVKVFNTGKIEIPGMKDDSTYNLLLNQVVSYLNPYLLPGTVLIPSKTTTILVNSNFNCGFFIKRNCLFELLQTKYNMQCIYDPCSYPGIITKYFHTDSQTQLITEMHFMIFRTGSVLISGNGSDHVLQTIYKFVTNLLQTEHAFICQHNINEPYGQQNKKQKNKKMRNTTITIINK
jgi:hypothetical protein